MTIPRLHREDLVKARAHIVAAEHALTEAYHAIERGFDGDTPAIFDHAGTAATLHLLALLLLLDRELSE